MEGNKYLPHSNIFVFCSYFWSPAIHMKNFDIGINEYWCIGIN